jgi:citrate lyase beta subunit
MAEYRVRRAVLYMPGDSRRKIGKAAGMVVDTIIMDIEDGVAYSQKAEARATILQALRGVGFGSNERLVRVNRVGSGWTATDIIETIAGRPDGYVIPKVERAADVIYVDRFLYDLETQYGYEPGSLSLHAIVESAQGILNVREIAQASRRLTALQFGAEDLAGDMGLTRTREGWEVFHARSEVAMAAKAHDLQAIDGVYLDFNDTEGAYEEARQVARMGFDGKMAIHPIQVEPYHRAFTPGDEEIAAARRLMEAHEAHQATGVGAFVLDGKMIDPAIVKPAERVLEKARAAGA